MTDFIDLQNKLYKMREHAEKQLRHCPYCIQHNKEFMGRYPDDRKSINVFSSSLAFKVEGRWYHLQLCAPQSNSRGGYNWQECSEREHHEYLAIIDGHTRTLEDAVAALKRED